jgi:hypothetical protein
MSSATEPVGPPEFGGGNEDPPTHSLVAGAEDPPTQSLVAGTMGDRCVSCGTTLTSDQRYCVNCGERRGTARFTLPASSSAGGETPAPSPPPPPRAPRASSGTTIVAGVGTLLLAMGVGVLIGRDSSNATGRTVQAAAPTVVTVAGGAASGASATTGSSGSAGKKSSKSKKSSKGKSKGSKPTAAQAAKASQAASKVLGSSKALPPATVTQGQSGSGPGFNKKSHKFDGSFFGQ